MKTSPVKLKSEPQEQTSPPVHYRSMDSRIKLDDEIETAEQRETFKQMLLRLLDDPQIQQKIGAFLCRSGLARSPGINVPQRWYP
jgi:hypothetical protein